MNFFFIIQGEGLGHTTQSLSLRAMLEKNGHSVVETRIGTNLSQRRNKLYTGIAHSYFLSPGFLKSRNKRGINLVTTFFINLLVSPLYIVAIIRLAYQIRISGADAVVVFYDLIGQLASFFSFSGKPVYSVSHHFFFSHPSFTFPENRKFERFLLKVHSRLASIGAHSILAISLSEEVEIPRKKIKIIPPLLRPEILQGSGKPDRHVHVYCLLSGFLNDMVYLANRYKEFKFTVFLHDDPGSFELPENISVFLISGDEFTTSIKTSGLVICTAGFETLAEAIYLNKALIIIPSENHFEQYCNSLDAVRLNAAICTERIEDINIEGYTFNPAHKKLTEWIAKAEVILIESLTNLPLVH